MDNKLLGGILILFSLVLVIIIFSFNSMISENADASCTCSAETGLSCPHQESDSWVTYLGLILLGCILALGIYLIFFEKSQKEIVSTLGKHKQMKIEEEKFNLILKGMDKDEQKVMKAIKEQDGISQQTLRLRTDLHKSKLSIVLDGLQKKGLIKKERKGKTNKIFLKIKV